MNDISQLASIHALRKDTSLVKPKRKAVTVTLKCNECGAKRKVSPNASSTDCRKCGGADVEVL